jgi:uncharacterized protein (UPF0303 family)
MRENRNIYPKNVDKIISANDAPQWIQRQGQKKGVISSFYNSFMRSVLVLKRPNHPMLPVIV